MTNPEMIFRRLTGAGMTKEGACAVLANLQAESAFRPNNVEDRSGIADEVYTANVDNGTYSDFVNDAYGYGLAQWTWGPRKKQLLLFAMSRGRSIGDLEMQIDFLIEEMKKDYSGIWSLCVSSHDLYDITKQLLYKWENPAEKENNMRLRYSYAQGWLEKFSGEAESGDVIQPSPFKGVTPQVVRAVLNGEYGNGQTRIDRLNADGYRADEVQSTINALYRDAAELKKIRDGAGEWYELVQDIVGVL